MNVLITGSSGYIGSNLIRSLAINQDYNITGLSKRSNGIKSPNYKEIIADLSIADFINKIPIHTKFDAVIHLAQSSFYRNFPEKAQDIFDVNTASTMNLLEWSRRKGIKKFIFSSTGNVYSPSEKMLVETDKCSSSSFYSASKILSETLVKEYANYLECYILRIFGVYGPGQNKMIISNLKDKIIKNEEITLTNNLGMVYTPLYIADCINMIEIMLKKSGKNIIYNFAGNESVNLNTITMIMSKALNIKPKIKITSGKTNYLNGNNQKFCKDFSFQPEYDVIKGLMETIKNNIK